MYIRGVLPRHEGRDGHSSPDVRRDAMDAVVPQGVRRSRVRSSRVVVVPRRWDQARSQLICGRRRLASPALRREHEAAVNHRAGNAGVISVHL